MLNATLAGLWVKLRHHPREYPREYPARIPSDGGVSPPLTLLWAGIFFSCFLLAEEYITCDNDRSFDAYLRAGVGNEALSEGFPAGRSARQIDMFDLFVPACREWNRRFQ